jgi:hypothetical protein
MFGDIMFWVAILFAMLLVLAAGTLWLRHWMKQDEDAPPAAGFTLHDLQELRRSGKLTEAEYQKLRCEVLAQAKATLQPPRKPPDEKPGPPRYS